MLEKSLKLSEAGDSIVRKLYFLIARCYRDMQQLDEALKRCQAGRVCFPDDAELLSQEGQIRRDLGDLAGAEACFVQLLEVWFQVINRKRVYYSVIFQDLKYLIIGEPQISIIEFFIYYFPDL